jgi:cellulose synthase (UDP-forming)
MGFYFDRFEGRTPPEPTPYRPRIELLWQFFAVIALVLGGDYLYWRWTETLNPAAMWFAIPLVLAETMAYIGLFLYTFNLWRTRDYPEQPAPITFSDCNHLEHGEDRPLRVDVFITTYSEDEELVRLSIRDAMHVQYPHPIELKVYILDDGRRPFMQQVATEEGALYISRDNNIGFKAGNLRNAMERTDGDFIVICDADTRMFPTFLNQTLGYFRDPDVAWVQTPQWFYDLPEGKPLPVVWQKRLGRAGYLAGRALERVVGPIQLGKDPFVNDPQMFYDVIQRRRNTVNASFCCGAGSVHRREAVMQAALREYAHSIEREVAQHSREISDPAIRADLEDAIRSQVALETEFTPYKFHVSEDIYTSIELHSDPTRRWKSVLHPRIQSKMLSPQDLQTWMVQRYKYAGGSLDIALRDNPVFAGKMTGSQRVMYMTTFWSYFGCIWNFVFLISPSIYLVTGISPVSTYSTPFYWHFLPFIIATELAFMFATWGVESWSGKASFMSFFPINFKALAQVLRGEKVKFPVTPKDRQEGRFLHLVYPQIGIVILTVVGLLWGLGRLLMGLPIDVSGFMINIFWGINNIALMLPMIYSAVWQPDPEPEDISPSSSDTFSHTSTTQDAHHGI